MTTFYAVEQQGVADGTKVPASKLDGTMVSAKDRRTRATLPGVAMVAADKFYLGKLPQGAVLASISGNVSASLGTTTISVGTLANPTKYVNAATLTTANVPTGLGPVASAWAQAPLTADEDLYVTLGVGGIANTVVGGFAYTFTLSA